MTDEAALKADRRARSARSSTTPPNSPSTVPSPIRPSSGPTSWSKPDAMAIPVLMPALSPTMTEGKLAKWHVKVGDVVKSGQVICEIETDKATMEVEAVDEGTVAQILIEEGTEGVAVNTPICILAADGESVADAARSAPAPAPAAAPAEPQTSRGAGPAEGRDTGAPPAAAKPAAEPEWTRQDQPHDGARGAARRHGRGDAQGRQRLPDGRGGRAVPGRLQGEPGSARRIRRPSA